MVWVNDMYDNFIGRDVNVKETLYEYEGKQYSRILEDDFDPAIREIKKLANGEVVRVWMPNTAGTMEMNPTRVNVNLEKNKGGKYEITKIWFG